MSGELMNPATSGYNMSQSGYSDMSDGDVDFDSLGENPTEAYQDDLLQYVYKQWIDAKYAKEPIENEMILCLKNRNAQYDEAILQAIKEDEGGSTFFDPITRSKVRGGIALLQDILAPYDGEIFDLDPTPIPDLPEDKRDEVADMVFQQAQPLAEQFNVMPQDEIEDSLMMIKEGAAQVVDEALELDRKEAKERAGRMKRLIYDQMVEGSFDNARNDFIDNLCTFKSAFMKMLFRKEKVLAHKRQKNGKYKQVVEEKVKICFESPSPFDIYPSPNSRDLNDHYFFERMKLTRSYLEQCRGLEEEGFISANIESLLIQFPTGVSVYDDIDRERNDEENRPFQDRLSKTDEYEILEYWGKISGRLLLNYGYDGDDIDREDPLKEYDVNMWVVVNASNAGRILKLTINKDPLGRRPYFHTSYVKIPNALWGEGIADLMKEDQQFCNQVRRAIANNMTLSSGPQVSIDAGRLPDGESLTDIKPYKIWQFVDNPMDVMAGIGGSTMKPIEFFQPPNNAQALEYIYQQRLERIDQYTGIYSYAQGSSDVSGAGSTARGLMSIMNNSNKVLRQVIRNIDNDVVMNIVRRMFEWNMLYHDDDLIKGDVNIVAKGALSLIVKEQTQIRLNELLNITNNPTDTQIIDMVYRGRLLREVFKDLDMPANDLVPPEEELQKRQEGVYQQEAINALIEQNPHIQYVLDGTISPEMIQSLLGSMGQSQAHGGEGGQVPNRRPQKGMDGGGEEDRLDPQM
jgi:hypothetical protein